MLSGINMFADGNLALAEQKLRCELHFYDYIFITKHRSLSKAVYCLELLVICWYDAWVLLPLLGSNSGVLLENPLVNSVVYVHNPKMMSEHM